MSSIRRFCMELTKVSNICIDNSSSLMDEHLRPRLYTRRASIPHRFSIEFMSGDLLGQSRTTIFLLLNHSIVFLLL
ncbi:unnamed protein product [Chironomus riparius]|uniref:Uncharacterized protein n=1 Tax=Chironomus riparius TaxID=315576 RepID=A0A9N9WVS8_9DIPT|nr:unnamed protein product [Chironomus riparius]